MPPVPALTSSSEQTKTIVEAWNVMAREQRLPVLRLVTEKRLKHLRARIGEAGLDGVLEAITAVPKSEFLCGHNDRGWCADFDFIMQPTSFARLLEGRYETRRPEYKNAALELLRRQAEKVWFEYDEDDATIEVPAEKVLMIGRS